MRVLAWRIVVNAILGTLATAIVGELCLGFAGIVITAAASLALNPWSDALAVQGFLFNAAAGALIFVVATLKSAPGEIIAPVRALLGRVVLGQIAGTLITGSAFLAFAIVKAQFQPLLFATSVVYDAFLLTKFAPLIVACGAIAGALIKRDLPQSATLNAE